MMFTNEDSALQYIIVRTLLYAERMHDHRKRKKEISMLLFEGYNSIRNLFFLSYIPYKLQYCPCHVYDCISVRYHHWVEKGWSYRSRFSGAIDFQKAKQFTLSYVKADILHCSKIPVFFIQMEYFDHVHNHSSSHHHLIMKPLRYAMRITVSGTAAWVVGNIQG